MFCIMSIINSDITFSGSVPSYFLSPCSTICPLSFILVGLMYTFLFYHTDWKYKNQNCRQYSRNGTTTVYNYTVITSILFSLSSSVPKSLFSFSSASYNVENIGKALIPNK